MRYPSSAVYIVILFNCNKILEVTPAHTANYFHIYWDLLMLLTIASSTSVLNLSSGRPEFALSRVPTIYLLSPVSIQTQSLALRKRKPQETQALALASSNHGCQCFDRAFLLAGTWFVA